MVYGVGFIWSLLGDVEDCGGVISLQAQSFSVSSEWLFVDSCPTLLDVVFMKGEEQSYFQRYKENYA